MERTSKNAVCNHIPDLNSQSGQFITFLFIFESGEFYEAPTQDTFPLSSANGLPTIYAQVIVEEEDRVAQVRCLIARFSQHIR